MTVLITLTVAGEDTGPFFVLYSDVDGYLSAFATVSKTDLLNGYSCNTVPDGTTVIRVKSYDNPNCTNYIDISVVPLSTTTTTSTSSSTTTTTTQPDMTLTYEVYSSGEPECGTCPKTAGNIKVNGVTAVSWLGSNPLPFNGPIAANAGDSITISADCYAGGSGCIDVTPTIVIYVNGVQKASVIDGTATFTFTYTQTSVISIELGCVPPIT